MIKFVCTWCGNESEPQGPIGRYAEVGDYLPYGWEMHCDPQGCSTICPCGGNK